MFQGISVAGCDSGSQKSKLVAHSQREYLYMSRTDLIADDFTIIRNAIMAKKKEVDVPSSNMIKAILEILKTELYIENFKIIDDQKQGVARIYLKYNDGKPAIRHIERISRPSRRTYVEHKKVPVILRGRGLAIISTSKGIMTDTQAREAGVGGEVIGSIW
jgi:small subunit ribosomal protein S8